MTKNKVEEAKFEISEIIEAKSINKVYVYTRVSTKKQDLTRQIADITNYAEANNLKIEKIFTDKQTGTNFIRKDYNELVDKTITTNDIVLIHSIDRLGRNKEELKEQIDIITKKRKAKLIIVTCPWLTSGINKEITDTTSKLIQELTFNLMYEFITTIAQFEVEQKKQRIKNGIENMEVRNGKKYSRKTGNFSGRPSIYEKIDKNKLVDYIKKGYKNKEIIELLKLKESTFYKLKSELKKENLI